MPQTTSKESTKKQSTPLERFSLAFEYNESWQDARRSFHAKVKTN